MEKSRAIEIIERHIDNNIASGSLVEQALSMAIDALKTQLSQEGTTSDLIDRRAALDIFDDYNVSVENGELEAYSRDRKRLCELPSVQPEPQWILITERLPRDGTWNIFTDGRDISVERYKADAIDHFFPNGRWFQLEDVIAWMPLPEPYKSNKKQSGKEGA